MRSSLPCRQEPAPSKPHLSMPLIALSLLLCVSGCNGCRNEQLSRKEIEKRLEEQKEPMEVSELISIPPDITTTDSTAKLLVVKNGHWITTQQEYKSNREDLQVLATGTIWRNEKEVPLPNTDFVVNYARRTSLPKGQQKRVELSFFVPHLPKDKAEDEFLVMQPKTLTFRTELLNWPLLTPVQSSPSLKPSTGLRDHEFLLYVISPEALGYGYLASLDAVYWRGDGLMENERTRSYRVVKVKPDGDRYPLPGSMLMMTSVAVIVWDDVAPDNLTDDQQQAILDWVHWGGQLIVSGPSSWSRLQGSFLSPFLPGKKATSTNLVSEDFAEISEFWQTRVLGEMSAQQDNPIQISGAPMSGLRFELSSRGRWLPHTGELVAESQVGRGRIVLTGFPLRDPRLIQWPYFSSFFSTGLLRRPPRTLLRHPDSGHYAQFWVAPLTAMTQDPRLHSSVRILSRDLGEFYQPSSSDLSADDSVEDGVAATDSAKNVATAGMLAPLHARLPDTTGQAPTRPSNDQRGSSSVAVRKNRSDLPLHLPDARQLASEAKGWSAAGTAWNDLSGVSRNAIEALRSAAGVELPSRQTILKLLAGYLILLVPVNWLVFRTIGRLEWAWIAAPIIAVIGVVVVTRVAQLDIGFARRATEIGVLEMYGDYRRGHLTQYVALYTSLSTNYAVDFPENDAVALPLISPEQKRRRASLGLRRVRMTYGQSAGVRLEPLTVYSNSTEMLHAEQIVDLGGNLMLKQDERQQGGKPELVNETRLNLHGAAVIHRGVDDSLQMAWVGELPGGNRVVLDYRPLNIDTLRQLWSHDPVTQITEPSPEALAGSESNALWIGNVLYAVVHNLPLMPGQTRLFAYTDDRLGKLAITPQEDQYDGRCLVVAHLTPEILWPIRPDPVIMLSAPGSGTSDESWPPRPPANQGKSPTYGPATGQGDADPGFAPESDLYGQP